MLRIWPEGGRVAQTPTPVPNRLYVKKTKSNVKLLKVERGKKKSDVKTLSRPILGFFTFQFRVFHVQLFFFHVRYWVVSRSICFVSRSIFAVFTSRFRLVRSRKGEVKSSDRISGFIPHTRYKSRNARSKLGPTVKMSWLLSLIASR